MSQKVISTFDASDMPREKCPRCGSRHLLKLQTADGWIKKCNDCRKVIPIEAPAEFQGELMTCAMCGKEQQSQPDVNSDWRLIEVNGRRHYVCTDHFPPDGANKEAFSEAYQQILRHLVYGKSDAAPS